MQTLIAFAIAILTSLSDVLEYTIFIENGLAAVWCAGTCSTLKAASSC